MPAPATVPEFLDLVRKSGLLPDATVDEVIDRHRAAATLPQAVDPFAALLVREGLLTFFQAKQLKLGRYKRFTIGSKYRLLELIGAGGMGAVYLCEHTLMKRLVALKVLPVEKLEDPLRRRGSGLQAGRHGRDLRQWLAELARIDDEGLNVTE